MQSCNRRLVGFRALLASVAILVLVMGIAMPATLAAPGVSDEIISLRRVQRGPDLLALVVSRLTVPAGAGWETDPDAGPLTLDVQRGQIAASIEGGLARIERRPNPLLPGQVGPLQPGREALLKPGDRLVVMRGFHLTVGNDGRETAVALVSRIH